MKIKPSALKILRLKNFKAFRELRLDLGKLTILIGENSSGKTSVLQSLLLLKQTLEAPQSVGTLDLRTDNYGVSFSSFRDIVYGMPKESASIGFGLSFDDFRVRFDIEKKKGEGIGVKKFLVNGRSITSKTSGYYHFLPRRFFKENEHESEIFEYFFEKIGYMGPLRQRGMRYYPLHGTKPSWIGNQGEDIANYLHTHPDTEDAIRNWFVQEAKLTNHIEFQVLPGDQMEIVFHDPKTGFKIDISRLGFGFSQILPIAAAVFTEMNFLIFEGPEIHLNPSLHGAIADLMIKGVHNGKQIIVETHSEHILYRLQRRVAEGKINKKDVAIYYVSRGKDGSKADRLKITDNGELPDWPTGFFESETEDIFGRLLAKTKV